MKTYLKYLVVGGTVLVLCLFFLPKKVRTETVAPRDYDEIAASGVLRAVTEYNTISYHAAGDSLTGFHYELLQAFARDHGWKVEITPEMGFEKRLYGVLSGEYDILANSVTVTSELKDTLLFTRPIVLNKQMLVQRQPAGEGDTCYIRSQLDLAHKTLYVVKGSPARLRVQNLSNEIGDTIYIREVDKYGTEQLLAMVAYGDIDYAVCEESIARVSMGDFPQLDIQMAIGFTQFCSWGINRQSPVLLDTLNAWLDQYTVTPAFRKLLHKYYMQ